MSLSRNVAVNIAGSVVPMVFSLVTLPIYLRLIGSERFGVLAVIWAMLGYFGFFDFGFGRAVTQQMSRLGDDQPEQRSRLLWTALTAVFSLGVVGSVALWLFSDFILTHMIHMSDTSRAEAASAVNWMLLALPLLLATSALMGALQARMRFVQVNIVQVQGAVLGQLFALGVAWTGHIDLSMLVPATLASRLITATLFYLLCRRYVPLRGGPVIDRGYLKSMASYGGWVSVSSFLTPLLVTVDRMVIASLSGARAVTHYTVPYDLVNRAMVVSNGFSAALFPRLAALKDADEARRIAIDSSRMLIAIMTPVLMAGVFLIHPFLVLWVGREFADQSGGVGEIILLGVWANAIGIAFYVRFLATNSPKVVALVYLIEIPIYLLMLWAGITYFGVVGAAVAWSMRSLMDACILMRLNGVLAQALKMFALSFVLMAVAVVVVLIAQPPVWGLAASAMALLAASFFADRAVLQSAYGVIRTRGRALA
jgi:O-antigen/teichoic acid export membrane protein